MVLGIGVIFENIDTQKDLGEQGRREGYGGTFK